MASLSSRFTFKIRSYEADYNNRLKISSIFNYMQVAAGLNANQLGFGYEQLLPEGYFWVLYRVILEWQGQPGFDEEIILETFPKGVEKIFALRDFNIYSQSGECIGKASTAWLLMDVKTQKLLMPNTAKMELPVSDLPPAIKGIPGRIEVPADKKLIGKRSVVYSDIDVNLHANNAKYIEYVFDALSPETFAGMNFCRIQINYLKELKIGDTFTIYHAEPENVGDPHYIEALIDEQRIFQCSIEIH